VIDPRRVEVMFMNCLFKDGEIKDNTPPADAVLIEGIVSNFGFHLGRLNNNKSEIIDMVMQLPDELMEAKGGGWSFLNLCTTRDGVLWTGEHRTMEQLLCMAIGLGIAKYNLPRDMWDVLPGSMPYVSFNVGA